MGRPCCLTGLYWSGCSVDLQLVCEVAEGSVLQRFHGADRPTSYLRDCFEGEVCDKAQDHDFALVAGERVECGDQGRIERFFRCGRVRRLVRPDDSRSTGAASTFVDQSMVRDGEDPAPQRGVVAVESIEPACDVDEYVAEEVVGFHGTRYA